MLRKVELNLRKRTWIDHKILNLRKCVLQFPTWELVFLLWVTDKLKNELRILIKNSREFRSANETSDERPLFRCVYGCLSLTNGCVKWSAPHLCDCHLPCDLAAGVFSYCVCKVITFYTAVSGYPKQGQFVSFVFAFYVSYFACVIVLVVGVVNCF